MSTELAPLASLDSVVDRLVAHLKDGRDTALISAPGCGATSLVHKIKSRLADFQMESCHFNLHLARSISTAVAQLDSLPVANSQGHHLVLIIDHSSSLIPEDLKSWIQAVRTKAPALGAICLWIGPLDARAILDDYGLRIHAVPKSHVSFPVLSRDEVLAVYRSIAEANDCHWGEAILYLVLDFCGNDFSLVRGFADFLHGDWTSKLYDVSIWDRVGEWLSNDPCVDAYRQRMSELPEPCRQYLRLIRLGGKPPCLRAELLEEVDPALRALCLQGFLVQNLLPGFYQLRNLTVSFIVQEQAKPWDGYRPEMLFRRATNERAARLLQDVEIMLRSVMFSVFHRLGESDVRGRLEKKQSDREFIPADLNRALLDWAGETGGVERRQSLNAILLDHRHAFRARNSIWARVARMMAECDSQDEEDATPEHLLCIDYLTLTELGGLLLDVFDEVFSAYKGNEAAKGRLKGRWQEYISKLGRLRNNIAHLRNVGFQDMEDLVGTVEIMRKDLIDHAGWR